MSETPPAEGTQFPVQFHVDVQSGADGRTWCTLVCNTAFTTFALTFPPEIAEMLAKELPKILRDVAREAVDMDNPLITMPKKLILPKDV